jgi:hypothetical protein
LKDALGFAAWHHSTVVSRGENTVSLPYLVRLAGLVSVIAAALIVSAKPLLSSAAAPVWSTA